MIILFQWYYFDFENKLDGYTTFDKRLKVKNINSNIYAIYGIDLSYDNTSSISNNKSFWEQI